MRTVALLRGVMPKGKNSIPKMSNLVEILSNHGFSEVKTYIQSGNILLNSDLNYDDLAKNIHDIILSEIGADLSVIIKTKDEFDSAVSENPFSEGYDLSRVHLVFSNDYISKDKLKEISSIEFYGEIFKAGSECLYMYLPRDAQKKRLNNNFLERKLGIVVTTRKLRVIKRLRDMI